MPGDAPLCLLRDCDEPAVMHVRHAEVGYRGECFCSWEHLLEYAHRAARREAERAAPSLLLESPDTGADALWAMISSQRAEHFIG